MTETPQGSTRDISAMLMPELRRVAGALGIKSGGMKKADLVAAIRGAHGGGRPSGAPSGEAGGGAAAGNDQRDEAPRRRARKRVEPEQSVQESLPTAPPAQGAQEAAGSPDRGERRPEKQRDAQQGTQQDTQRGTSGEAAAEATQADDQHSGSQQEPKRGRRGSKQQDGAKNDKQHENRNDARSDGGKQGQQDKQGGGNQGNQAQQDKQGGGNQGNQAQQDKQGGSGQGNQDKQGNQTQQDDDENGSRRNRRRRGRDRQQAAPRGNRNEPDTTVLDDDVLLPCAGILDVLDNYAFVRTTGYLAGPDDVYVSLSMVRKLGLRPGDAISGQVRLPREGERKEKFNPLVKIDSVNGADPELSRSRKDFDSLKPLYPTDRLRMETRSEELIGRVIDVAAPIGKGQRGLVVSPARAGRNNVLRAIGKGQRGLVVSPECAGRTTVLRAIADAVSTNNPECHLMVVLIDERPEEVTEFERSVRGEVISSTFDRPPSDHTAIAELAIERAKRLVELGHDVVVLLDGVTTLGRAYNLAAPPSGRTLAGGVDAAALYPPKRFFGAARNIEGGGSLTIVATATVESGSVMDEVILEEFGGTATMELRLRRDLADRWLFPAVDVLRSSTRREELLLGAEEIEIARKLRRALSHLESARGLEMVLARMGRTRTNYEFLSALQRAEDSELTAD